MTRCRITSWPRWAQPAIEDHPSVRGYLYETEEISTEEDGEVDITLRCTGDAPDAREACLAGCLDAMRGVTELILSGGRDADGTVHEFEVVVLARDRVIEAARTRRAFTTWTRFKDLAAILKEEEPPWLSAPAQAQPPPPSPIPEPVLLPPARAPTPEPVLLSPARAPTPEPVVLLSPARAPTPEPVVLRSPARAPTPEPVVLRSPVRPLPPDPTTTVIWEGHPAAVLMGVFPPSTLHALVRSSPRGLLVPSANGTERILLLRSASNYVMVARYMVDTTSWCAREHTYKAVRLFGTNRIAIQRAGRL